MNDTVNFHQHTQPTPNHMVVLDDFAVMPDGQKLVGLRVESVNGSFIFALSAEAAVTVGQVLIEAGNKNQHGGLLVAGAPGVSPDMMAQIKKQMGGS